MSGFFFIFNGVCCAVNVWFYARGHSIWNISAAVFSGLVAMYFLALVVAGK